MELLLSVSFILIVLYVCHLLWFWHESGIREKMIEKHATNPILTALLIQGLVWTFFIVSSQLLRIALKFENPEVIKYAIRSGFLFIAPFSILLSFFVILSISGRIGSVSIGHFDRVNIREITKIYSQGSNKEITIRNRVSEIWIRSRIFNNQKSTEILNHCSPDVDLNHRIRHIVYELDTNPPFITPRKYTFSIVLQSIIVILLFTLSLQIVFI